MQTLIRKGCAKRSRISRQQRHQALNALQQHPALSIELLV
jgi:hypothetical protein